MATITTINETDYPSDSRAVINTNFTNLNTDKIETSVISTDGTLSGNSDTELPTEKAVKTYVDTNAPSTTFPASTITSSPTTGAWTDADLSATIGTASRMVAIKVTNTSGADEWVAIRKNGDTGTYYDNDQDQWAPGASGAVLRGSTACTDAILICPTDSSGVIEYYTNGNATFVLESYW